jgi:hypothetical protein
MENEKLNFNEICNVTNYNFDDADLYFMLTYLHLKKYMYLLECYKELVLCFKDSKNNRDKISIIINIIIKIINRHFPINLHDNDTTIIENINSFFNQYIDFSIIKPNYNNTDNIDSIKWSINLYLRMLYVYYDFLFIYKEQNRVRIENVINKLNKYILPVDKRIDKSNPSFYKYDKYNLKQVIEILKQIFNPEVLPFNQNLYQYT